MPASFDDQRRWNQRHLALGRNAQPKIVILADRQRLIETSHPFEQILSHHDGGRTNQTEIQATVKEVPRWLAMPLAWINSHAAAKPYFLGLADLDLWIAFHESGLDCQFLRQPKIVRVEKCDIPPLRDSDTQVAGGRHASSGLRDES
jgi:hypothetical protein